MIAAFGMHVRFRAQPGQGDALSALLLEASNALSGVDACRLYLVSRLPDDANSVWVTEAWTSREAHAASLEDERAKATIQRAKPLIVGAPEATELRPAGGKGP
jgi:quinol monooxygenase YgiN